MKPSLERSLTSKGLQEFGAKVWVHDANGSKLDGRSTIGCWVSFDEESSGHRIYWPERRSVSIERSVKFDDEAEILLPNSALLEGENSTPLLKNPSQFEQPTVPNPPRAPIIPENPATTFADNPTVDHLGHDFEQPSDNQGRPKWIY